MRPIVYLSALLLAAGSLEVGCQTLKHEWEPVEKSGSTEAGVREGAGHAKKKGSGSRNAGSAGGEKAPRPETSSAPAYPNLIKRGEYLVSIGSCNDCHTPQVFRASLRITVPDASRRLSGHPEYGLKPASIFRAPDAVAFGADMTSMRTAMGLVYAANLTSDKETGLGSIPQSLFIATMRTGLHLGSGRPILPPMPWQSLARASDADLEAIYAYLQSLPPIRNRVPQPQVSPEVYDQLREAYGKLVQDLGQTGPGS